MDRTSREGPARRAELLSLLTDRIQATQSRRLVLDGVSRLATKDQLPETVQQMLTALVKRFRSLGVTSILTVEAQPLYSTGLITDFGLSPVADDIFVLRYVQLEGENRPTLVVVKTRGSKRARGTDYFSIQKGGIRIEERVGVGVLAKKNSRKRTPAIE